MTFSIIIPVYNVAPYLRECLDSVSAQTFTDWEAICVDDGSTDGSGAILDEYLAKDKRFRVIHQHNAGVSASRNAALDIVGGDYIGFLDGDDVWLSDWLSVVAAEIKAHTKVDWVRLDFTRWTGGARPQITKVGPSEFYDKDVPFLLWNMICRSGYGWMNFYRRECVGAHRFKVGLKVSEDTLFALGVANQLITAVIIPYDGYLYRQREGSALTGMDISEAKDVLAFLGSFVSLVELMSKADGFVESCRESVEYRARLCTNRWWDNVNDMTSQDCRLLRGLVHRLKKHCFLIFRQVGFKRKMLRGAAIFSASPFVFRLLRSRRLNKILHVFSLG